ncbi:MAG: peptidoglycan DD-metalloendopeptidase family protein [Rhodospirillaceae bacterium]|nr:peptidoglycan DD-metalloendopeptidase family protein [Rhodospirillaceae bacterium]
MKRLLATLGGSPFLSPPHSPSLRRNVIAVTIGLLAGGAIAAAIVTQQTEKHSSTQQAALRSPLPVVPGNLPAAPLVNVEARPTTLALALPLAPISVKAARPTTIQRVVSITPGDTLMAVMTRSGSDRSTAHAAIAALSKVYNPRRLRPGQELVLMYDPLAKGATPDNPPLTQLAFTPSVEQEIQVSLNENGKFTSKIINKPLEVRLHRASATIDNSLYLAAKRAGMPATMIVELIRLYSFDVDFQRDIQPGDRFEVLYEAHYDERGELAKYGDIHYAKLRVQKTDLPLYRFAMKSGDIDYFNDKGHSVRKALMKTPVDGARLTSRFGRRKHPILGYRKMHRGIDFGAPKGTPVLAAGSGAVEFAGRNGGYGRYLRIRHNGQYKTAYAHLSGFRRGVKKGKRVKQGQIVAYVGSTGRSTGPHLHYEILVNGKRINPLGLKLPTGQKLKGKQLARFQGLRRVTKKQFAETPALTRLADRRQ